MPRKTAFTMALLLSALIMIAAGCPQRATPRQAPPQTPQTETKQEDVKEELAIRDNAPEGCATCHVKKDDKDYTLAAEVKQFPNHPTLPPDATVKNCVACHGPTSERPLGRILHVGHLKGNVYPKKYDSNCINCHRMADNGDMAVKGLEASASR